MSLTMYVGLGDEAEHVERRLAAINKALASRGLPAHAESADEDDDDYWNFMIRYGAVEELQKTVRRLQQQGTLDLSAETLSHLLAHSTVDGFFLPRDFSPLIVDGDCHVGSCVQLQAICLAVAEALEFPEPFSSFEIDYSGEGEELEEALEGLQEEGGAWTGHILSVLVALVLFQGAEVSLRTGKALGFG